MFEWLIDAARAISIVNAIMPLIDLLVKTSEAPGHGPEKKATVLKGIKDTLTGLEVPEAILKIVLAIAGAVIDAIVLALNIAKIFTHKSE